MAGGSLKFRTPQYSGQRKDPTVCCSQWSEEPLQDVTPILAGGSLNLGTTQYSGQRQVPTVCRLQWSSESLRDVTPILARQGARGTATNWGQLITDAHSKSSKSLEIEKN